MNVMKVLKPPSQPLNNILYFIIEYYNILKIQ